MKNCLLCCSGSVATLKVPELAVELSSKFNVLIVASQKAMFFLERAENYNPNAWKRFLFIGGWNIILRDEDELSTWNSIGDIVLHIELRRWAGVFSFDCSTYFMSYDVFFY